MRPAIVRALLGLLLALTLLPAAPTAPVARAADPPALVPLHTRPDVTPLSQPIRTAVTLGENAYAIRGSVLWRYGAPRSVPESIYSFNGADALVLSVVNGRILIEAFNRSPLRYRLWSSDGTTAGTLPLVDRVINGTSYYSESVASLDVGAVRYFAQQDSFWRTDGTLAGTVKLFDGPLTYSTLMSLGSRVLVFGAGPVTGIWATDGTPGNTRQLTVRTAAQPPTVIGRQALFVTDSGELWRTDGTAAGTGQVRAITRDGSALTPRFLTAIGSHAYFTAGNGSTTLEVWRTDGTSAGTARLLQSCRSACSLLDQIPPSFTQLGSGVVFIAPNGQQTGLWRIDGNRVTPIASFGNRYATILTVVGRAMLFLVYPPGNVGRFDDRRPQLWRSDGTAAGTFTLPATGYIWVMAKTASVALLATVEGFLRTDGSTSGTLPFGDFGGISWTRFRAGGFDILGADKTGLYGLWRGSPVGEFTLVRSFSPTDLQFNTILNSDPLVFTAAGGLWRSDGTTAGTYQLDSAVPYTLLAPGLPVQLGGQWLYRDSDTDHGRELWTTDGTATGTQLLKDICAGWCDSAPDGLTQLGSKLLFFADDGVHGREPWITDGTAAGTQLLADISPGQASSIVQGDVVTLSAGVAYFVAVDQTTGVQIWRTDGTAAGTRRFTRLGTGVNPSSNAPRQLTAAGGKLAFTITVNPKGEPTNATTTLYVSDGSAQPVALSSATYISNMTALGTRVLFTQTDPKSKVTLMVSDGTPAGTVRLAPAADDAVQFAIAQIVGSGNRAYVALNNGGSILADGQIAAQPTTSRLLVTDGTAAGTQQLLNGTDYLRELHAVSGGLFFLQGNTLWTSDGTAAGTSRVRETPPPTVLIAPTGDCRSGCPPFERKALTTAGDLLVYIAFPEEGPALYAVPVGAVQAVQIAPLGVTLKSLSEFASLGEPIRAAQTPNALLLALYAGPKGPGLYAAPLRPADIGVAGGLTTGAPSSSVTVPLTLLNDGLTAGAARLAVTLPAGVTFVDSPLGPPSVSGSTYTWDLAAVPVGGQAIVLRLAVPDAPLGTRYPLAVSVTPTTGAASTAEVTVFVARQTVLPTVMR